MSKHLQPLATRVIVGPSRGILGSNKDNTRSCSVLLRTIKMWLRLVFRIAMTKCCRHDIESQSVSQTGRGWHRRRGSAFVSSCLPNEPANGRHCQASSQHARSAGSLLSGHPGFLDAVQRSKPELHSFMFVRHGHVVAEGWWSPYGPQFNHTLYSLSKSFTSTAVGFAVAEGKLHVDDRVVSFFPNDLPENVSEHLAALRIKDLLTMSVGNAQEPTRPMVEQQNWVRTFLAWPIPNPPGTQFMYNSAATYMLSAIVQQVTGQKILDYLQPRLFEPLGIHGETWETCPRGINVGGWGLSIQTEGLAKFGQLYLQKGAWQGKQLLPAQWVDEATTFKIQQPLPAKPSRPNDQNDWLQGYCYQFWRCRHNAFRGDGAFGQYMIVMPEQDAVVAITAEVSDMQGELDLVWDHLLPAMKAQPLPRDRPSEAQLQQTLASLTLAPPTGQSSSPTAASISGKTFNLDSNELGLQSASFAFSSARLPLRNEGQPGGLSHRVRRRTMAAR